MAIVGTPGDDALFGTNGNDVMRGGAGNDVVVGGAGNDNLGGGEGNDVLRGGDGNDTLFGNAGNDNLGGGAGADLFVFDYRNGAESGFDTVIDFTVGQDQLEFHNVPGFINVTLQSQAEIQSFIDTLNADTTDGSFVSEDGNDLLLRFSDSNVVRLSGLAGDFVV